MTTPTSPGSAVVPPGVRPVGTPLAELGTGAAWLLGLSAANQIVAILFRSNPFATVVLQAVLVDLAIGRAGVRWEPEAAPDDAAATTPATATTAGVNPGVRILVGAGLALAVTLIGLGLSVGLGWAKLSAIHAPSLSLLLGLLRAVAIGVRDALLYVALPLHFAARASRIPRAAVIAFAALAAGAAMVLQPAATPANVTLAITVSGLTAVLWARDGAGWAAVGLAGGWAFFAGTLFRGALVDIDWKTGSLAPGFVADGPPAWFVAAWFAAIALAMTRRAPPARRS